LAAGKATAVPAVPALRKTTSAVKPRAKIEGKVVENGWKKRKHGDFHGFEMLYIYV